MRCFLFGCLVLLLSGCELNSNPGGPSAPISPSAVPRPPVAASPPGGFQQKSLQEARREMLEKKAKEEGVSKASDASPSGAAQPPDPTVHDPKSAAANPAPAAQEATAPSSKPRESGAKPIVPNP